MTLVQTSCAAALQQSVWLFAGVLWMELYRIKILLALILWDPFLSHTRWTLSWWTRCYMTCCASVVFLWFLYESVMVYLSQCLGPLWVGHSSYPLLLLSATHHQSIFSAWSVSLVVLMPGSFDFHAALAWYWKVPLVYYVLRRKILFHLIKSRFKGCT